jgi:hypothetical protein
MRESASVAGNRASANRSCEPPKMLASSAAHEPNVVRPAMRIETAIRNRGERFMG